MKVAILAAGLGSRFGGIKQLASIGSAGETLLEYNIYNALQSGFDSVVFLIRRDIEADFVETVLPRLPKSLPVELAFQDPSFGIPERLKGEIAAAGRKKPWGTGHALLCTRELLSGGPFAVINADDFYGARGFKAVHDCLAGQAPDGRAGAGRPRMEAAGEKGPGAPAAPARFCLAGYRLGNVVSKTGSVSRAICQIDAGGNLSKIVEHTRVEVVGETLRSTWPDGHSETLSPELPASMNFWGLTPAIFPQLEERFAEFLSDPAHWAKAEFFLPTVIGGMIDEGAATARALSVNETYFGLTNPEDIVGAREAIAERTARGEYPAPLWSGYAAGRKTP